MRGKDLGGSNRTSISRITPAYAGKRSISVVGMRFPEDHPRLCGEKFGYMTTSKSSGGSPPPMRGKGYLSSMICDGIRITPAYAGKSRSFRICLHEPQDHPRLCGEKSCQHLLPACKPGITPAYAGKSSFQFFLVHASWDHPRLCGEKTAVYKFPAAVPGSPPPMRGKAENFPVQSG